MKPIIFTHENPLLEDFSALAAEKPESYEGFVYMWKCIPEDRYYIGSHQGVANDEYRGSGRTFKRVFEYYGITQFRRVILEYVETVAMVKVREQHWLNVFRAVQSDRFYNQKNAVAIRVI
jgi:hypothetical protein